eukprot:316863-Prymnesium_polylepis.1
MAGAAGKKHASLYARCLSSETADWATVLIAPLAGEEITPAESETESAPPRVSNPAREARAHSVGRPRPRAHSSTPCLARHAAMRVGTFSLMLKCLRARHGQSTRRATHAPPPPPPAHRLPSTAHQAHAPHHGALRPCGWRVSCRGVFRVGVPTHQNCRSIGCRLPCLAGPAGTLVHHGRGSTTHTALSVTRTQAPYAAPPSGGSSGASRPATLAPRYVPPPCSVHVAGLISRRGLETSSVPDGRSP